MKTTSEFAKEFFKKKFDWAKRYGASQIEHTVKTLTERFHEDAFLAACAAVFDDIKVQHAQCVASGVVDQYHDKSIEKSAINISGHNALSVRYPDGNNLLFVFSENVDGEGDERSVDSNLKVMTWADPVPVEALAEYEASFRKASSYAELEPIIQNLASLGGIEQDTSRIGYGKLPVSLSDLVTAIEKRELRNVGGVGTFRRNAFSFMLERSFFNFDAFAGEKCSLDIIKRMFAVFTPVEEYKGSKGDEFFALLKTGKLDEAFASCCALSLEYHLEHEGLSKIDGIVTASEELGLTMESALAYHDTKICVYAERHHDRDVYVNTDLDGSCSATVVSRINGDPATLHVYEVQTWWAGFSNYWGHDETDPLVEGKELEYAKYGLTRRSLIPEHNLIDQLRSGTLPEENIAMMYDFRSKVLEVARSMENSGYLTYWTDRVTRDQEIVANAAKGEFPEWGAELHEHSRGDTLYRHISIEDFIARKAAPSI